MLRRLLTGLTICFAITAPALAVPTPAKIETGNDLLGVCETPRSDTNGPELQLYCAMFIGDLFYGPVWREKVSVEDAQGNRCIPQGVNVRQLRDISIRFLRENPQLRHHTAEALVLKSIVEAFPNCKIRWLN